MKQMEHSMMGVTMKSLSSVGAGLVGRILGETVAAAAPCEGTPYTDTACIDGLRYKRTCYYDRCERRTICGAYKWTGNFC